MALQTLITSTRSQSVRYVTATSRFRKTFMLPSLLPYWTKQSTISWKNWRETILRPFASASWESSWRLIWLATRLTWQKWGLLLSRKEFPMGTSANFSSTPNQPRKNLTLSNNWLSSWCTRLMFQLRRDLLTSLSNGLYSCMRNSLIKATLRRSKVWPYRSCVIARPLRLLKVSQASLISSWRRSLPQSVRSCQSLSSSSLTLNKMQNCGRLTKKPRNSEQFT